MIVSTSQLWRSAHTLRQHQRILIPAGVVVVLVVLLGVPLFAKAGVVFAASAPVTQSMTADGHQLTIHMQQVGVMNKVIVNDTAPQGSRSTGGVYTFIYDTGAQMLYNTIQVNGAPAKNFAVKLDANSLAQREQMMQQAQKQQVQQLQSLNSGVALAQTTTAQANVASSRNPITGDGFSFTVQKAANGQPAGIVWTVTVGGSTITTVETPDNKADLQKFQEILATQKNAIGNAIGDLGAAGASALGGILTSETGVGAVVGATLALGFISKVVGQAITIYNQQVSLQNAFVRIQAGAVPPAGMDTTGTTPNGNTAPAGGTGNNGITGPNGAAGASGDIGAGTNGTMNNGNTDTNNAGNAAANNGNGDNGNAAANNGNADTNAAANNGNMDNGNAAANNGNAASTNGNTDAGNAAADNGNGDNGNAGNADPGNADPGNADAGNANADNGNADAAGAPTDTGNGDKSNVDTTGAGAAPMDAGNAADNGNADATNGNADAGNGTMDAGNTDNGTMDNGNADAGNADAGDGGVEALNTNGGIIIPGQQAPSQGFVLCPICN